ncbi:hypothetical protein MXB_658 [Myxobolus squamalis]|nr:hypothetical protein MXB_658 [Myxobolus squamalis]
MTKLSDKQALNIRDFGCARSSEIISLLQCMPVHLRRRTSSRKYTQLNKNRVNVNKISKRKFTKTKYKNRSRCSKRKDKIDSDVPPLRLTTHLWHSKRFHMITRYKYRLPFSTTCKSYRPTFNCIKNGVVLQDISYISPLKLVGESFNIIKLLKHHINDDNKISYLRETTALFYESINIEESLIGPVLISLFHPLIVDKVFDALNFSNTNSEVNVSRLKNVSRFRMIGPLSIQLMLNTLQPIENSKANTVWNDLLAFFISVYDFPYSAMLGCFIDDNKSKKNYGSLYKSSKHIIHSPDI